MPPRSHDLEQPEDIDELLPFMEAAEEDLDMEPMDESFPECVAVDNLPKVDEAKKPKLLNVLKKIFSQVGEIAKLELPMGQDGISAGFAFIEFTTKQSAQVAVDKVDGYKLDKTHVFKVIPYVELGRLSELSAEYVPPPAATFQPPADLASWLSDASGRDQFVTRHAVGGREETGVQWGEVGRPPKLFYGGEREKEAGLTWCEKEVKWSPKGSYLCTFHLRGVALWGGPSMEKEGRFAHDNVNRLSFSPCERFMLTCNFRPPRDGESTVTFWDIKEAKVLRKMPLSFVLRGGGDMDNEARYVPNLLKWSADGSYVAHLSPETKSPDSPNGLIKVYALPSMQLLDAKSIRTNGVMDFEWSPADNQLAYWAAEEGNTPARVALLAIPSRQDLRQKNLFSVTECHLTWQPSGDFLAVKVVRHTKSKKTHFNNLELFRVREDLVPVETLDVKTPVMALSWEPNHGTRFALLTADTPKPTVSFYDMGPLPDDVSKVDSGRKSECVLLKALLSRQCSHVMWSPVGGQCVLAGLAIPNVNDYSGQLEFYDVDELPDRGVEREHYRANACEWDPSGRSLVSAVTQPFEGMVYKFQMDNGFHLWTFQGEEFYEKSLEKFYSFSWRPRPACLLDDQERKKVVKNLRKFERKFERADREEKRSRDLLMMASEQKLRTEHRELLAERRARNYAGIRLAKKEARYDFDEDDDANYVIETVQREVVVDSKEEVVAVL